eukprot:CAMPEP_0178940110 /NCGR_PEP_ID=MMETSP0789-20121207/610_1 /TAXON_ID=3005 /ORGANISM="Rhizosolenia setigera, Strain CCMP 1694" /LENGTH=194 /DNA_ID=CAMNT_0020619079 /DNA_START=97 /DNA_END=681 /DNA_ORIENTATION=+
MVKITGFVAALLATSASAFAPTPVARPFVTKVAASSIVPEVDNNGNNIKVKDLLVKIEESGLLTEVARSGLLSKAQDAGISLTKLEPLIDLAASNPEILILVEASGPELLPVLPKVVEIAPGALPLAVAALGISPGLLNAGAFLSVAAAAGAVVVIPDDTIANVAIQTLAVATLGAAVPAASIIGAKILTTLTK